jgi:hypothetical protein
MGETTATHHIKTNSYQHNNKQHNNHATTIAAQNHQSITSSNVFMN